jgi:hypothetical protein
MGIRPLVRGTSYLKKIKGLHFNKCLKVELDQSDREWSYPTMGAKIRKSAKLFLNFPHPPPHEQKNIRRRILLCTFANSF